MRLNLATDYALRSLLFLGASQEEWTSAARIAESFAISTHHVRAVCKTLVGAGWVEGRRGSKGGLRLLADPALLSVGEVVRALEPLELVECFDAERNGCALDPTCRLKGALEKASKAFLEVLDGFTLAEISGNRKLRRLVLASEPR